jgi:hypothetical protein
VLPTVGLVVEGDAEFYALPRLSVMVTGCPPLKATNLGGVGPDLTAQGVAKRALSSVLAHLFANRTRVIVVLDRESRQASSAHFEAEVLHELSALLAARKTTAAFLQVIAADRAFEAWILADAKGLHEKRFFRTAPRFHSFEGQMGERNEKGKREITSLLGEPYSETRHGPKLFEAIDPAAARAWQLPGRGSRSFDRFLTHLGL